MTLLSTNLNGVLLVQVLLPQGLLNEEAQLGEAQGVVLLVRVSHVQPAENRVLSRELNPVGIF